MGARAPPQGGSGREAGNELPSNPRDLQIRDGALAAHAVAERGLAGGFDLALFRGVRRGHRRPHRSYRRRELRRLHRAGLIMLMLLTQSVMNASFGIYFPRSSRTISQ